MGDAQHTDPKIVAYAQSALEQMAAHGVPPTPKNYAVWYSFLAGQDPQAEAALRPVLESGQGFTPQLNDQLFGRIFGGSLDSLLLRDISDRLQTAICRLLQEIGQSSGDTGRYRHALQAFSEELRGIDALDRLGHVVENILAHTADVEQKSGQLETHLSSTSSELDGLRQRLEEFERQAMTDPLTGIGNRRAFDNTLAVAIGDAERTNTPLSLIMADIDHFKKFNDRHGHKVGDQVIKVVAKILAERMGDNEIAGRYGGEEFGLILPGRDLDSAVILAEEARERVKKKRIVKRATGEDLGTVTLSLGVARYIPGESADQFVERADSALYAAKNAGRNTVIAAGEPAPAQSNGRNGSSRR